MFEESTFVMDSIKYFEFVLDIVNCKDQLTPELMSRLERLLFRKQKNILSLVIEYFFGKSIKFEYFPWTEQVLRFKPKRPSKEAVLPRKDLPMIIKGREVRAQHDTGAEGGNFMDEKLARELRLRLRQEKSDCKPFSMGNGKIIRAIGRVRAACAFSKEPSTTMKCWFYVFKTLESPLTMGSQFLEKTQTLSKFVHRLADRLPCPNPMPSVCLIGSTQQAKRRLAAFIDDRPTHINADSGSHLDLMSSSYARKYGYTIDKRIECRKRVRLADGTTTDTIGQVSATLTMKDRSSYERVFDVLPALTSDVVLGEPTLEGIGAFTLHEDSFVDVLAGERYLEVSVLGYLGKVSEFLARNIRRRRRGRQAQQQPSLAKRQDNAMTDALHAEDLETERRQQQQARNEAAAAPLAPHQTTQTANQGQRQQPQPPPSPAIPPRSPRRRRHASW
ncbi:MAG: hypothetical protein Q9161_005506 [Pseudevernia consocians]